MTGTEEQVELLVEAGVDLVVVDGPRAFAGFSIASNGSRADSRRSRSSGQHRHRPAAQALTDHGADAVKVGIGPGSI